MVRSLLDAEDTRVMRAALEQLGVRCVRQGEADDYLVHGVAGRFPCASAALFLGNAGTALRPLVAALALQGGDYRLSGVARMHERPIADLVESLQQIGAAIDYLGEPGYPPLHIGQGHIAINKPVQVRSDVSSQFMTALLLTLPMLSKSQGEINVHVQGALISQPYVALTLHLLRSFGIEVAQHGWSRFVVPADAYYQSPGEITVEGDASSASYFLAAGAIAGGPVRVIGVGRTSMQGDVQFAGALARMGAHITMGDNWIEVAANKKQEASLQSIEINCSDIPDAAMTLAMCALFATGRTTLTHIASWRVKETDRIAAMARELIKLGAQIEEGSDFLSITAPSVWQVPLGGIDTYDDHRMAMCFSLAALGPVPITINDPGCVVKTFPDYFALFSKLTH